jgi:predicted GTPase
MRTIVIMGAASRDFNVVFRDDLDIRVAAFTAAQIPGIENRAYAIARRAASVLFYSGSESEGPLLTRFAEKMVTVMRNVDKERPNDVRYPRLFVARSKIHGLGLFAGEDIEWDRISRAAFIKQGSEAAPDILRFDRLHLPHAIQ